LRPEQLSKAIAGNLTVADVEKDAGLIERDLLPREALLRPFGFPEVTAGLIEDVNFRNHLTTLIPLN